jgi:hypothetical protein
MIFDGVQALGSCVVMRRGGLWGGRLRKQHPHQGGKVKSELDKHWDALRAQGVVQISPAHLKQIKYTVKEKRHKQLKVRGGRGRGRIGCSCS